MTATLLFQTVMLLVLYFLLPVNEGESSELYLYGAVLLGVNTFLSYANDRANQLKD